MGKSLSRLERDLLILAIDTSGETCSIAVSDSAVCRVEYSFRHERRLIERIPGIVQSVLSDAGVTLADIEVFAVGLGPGSFTGVRVGVTMAKVWAMTLDKPVVGVSSLDALAEPWGFLRDVHIATFVPTRRMESIAAFYSGNGNYAPHEGPVIVANDALVIAARHALGEEPQPVLVIGENPHHILEATPEWTRALVRPVTRSVSAAAVTRLALPRLERGDYDDTDTLFPMYVTPPPTG